MPWRKIWTNLWINRATRKANQLIWKIIHNTIDAEAKLQKMGRSMNGLCHFCNTLNFKTFILRLHSHTTKLSKNDIGVKKLHEHSWNEKYNSNYSIPFSIIYNTTKWKELFSLTVTIFVYVLSSDWWIKLVVWHL